jgi:hypothetical protein
MLSVIAGHSPRRQAQAPLRPGDPSSSQNALNEDDGPALTPAGDDFGWRVAGSNRPARALAIRECGGEDEAQARKSPAWFAAGAQILSFNFTNNLIRGICQ